MPHYYGAKIWYYKVDPELKIIHVFKDCRGLKIAWKYEYVKEFVLHDGDEVEALALDNLLSKEGYRCCHNCWKREQGLARKEARRARPGFIGEPAK